MRTSVRNFLTVLCMIFLFSVVIVPKAFSVKIIGPVGIWRFDENSGNVAYDSQNWFIPNNPGTLYGDATWTRGKLGYALSFDGVNDYVRVRTDVFSNYNQSTEGAFTLWVYRNKIQSQTGLINYSTLRPLLYFGSSGNLQVHWNGANNPYTGEVSIPTGEWHHIGVTWQNNTFVRIYVDGVKKYEGNFGNMPTKTRNIRTYIGTYLNGNYFNGIIDEVKIYNYALNDEKILKEYESTGLTASWRFDENYENVTYDDTDNNNDGNVYGTSWKTYGINNSALSFNGYNSYVNCGNNESLNITNAITLEAWVMLKNYPATNFSIISKYNAGVIGSYFLNVMSNGKLQFSIEAPLNYVISTKSLSLNTWHHIVATFNGINKAIYIDGRLDSQKTGGGLHKHSTPVLIGALFVNNQPTNFCSGIIDEIKIYDRALSKYEIEKSYKTLSASLISYWSFNEGTGNVAYDYTANNNSAIRYAAIWSPGIFSSALDFTGRYNYVKVPTDMFSNYDQSTEGAFTLWIYRNKIQNQTGLIKYSNLRPLLYFGDSGNLQVHWNGATNPYTGEVSIPTGEWHHIGITWQNNTFVRIYVDGVNKYEGNFGNMPTKTNDIRTYIGTYLNGNYFNGRIDELKIYNCALTLEEINEEYNLQSPSANASSVQQDNWNIYGPLLAVDNKRLDNILDTRWSSKWMNNAPNPDSQWIYIDLKTPRTFNTVKLHWEYAYGKKYKIQISNNRYKWETIYEETGGDKPVYDYLRGRIDEILVGPKTARYIKMQGIERGSSWGYSLWEFSVYK